MEKTYNLVTIINECTKTFRKGTEFTTDESGAVHVWLMDHFSTADERFKLVDLHFHYVGVDETMAKFYRVEFIQAVVPLFGELINKREVGYIELGAIIGSQDAAFLVFAVGEVLGLWQILSPSRMGFTGEIGDQLAGQGYITITTKGKPIGTIV